MILDWRELVNDKFEPWIERSNTQQDIYNKKINKLASDFLKNSLVPKLNEELVEKLGNGKWIEITMRLNGISEEEAIRLLKE